MRSRWYRGQNGCTMNGPRIVTNKTLRILFCPLHSFILIKLQIDSMEFLFTNNCAIVRNCNRWTYTDGLRLKLGAFIVMESSMVSLHRWSLLGHRKSKTKGMANDWKRRGKTMPILWPQQNARNQTQCKYRHERITIWDEIVISHNQNGNTRFNAYGFHAIA